MVEFNPNESTNTPTPEKKSAQSKMPFINNDYTNQPEADNEHSLKQKVFKAAGFPYRHMLMNWDHSKSPEWTAALQRLVDRTRSGHTGICVICGDRGSGKTQMATCFGKFWVGYTHGNTTIQYIRLTEFLCELRETYDDSSRKTERQVIEKYVQPQLLVVDEIHCRRETEWERIMLDTLIDKRYAIPQSMTVLVGNVKEQELSASLGPTIYDRILETGVLVECNWPGFRG